jgi:hypothetical protein
MSNVTVVTALYNIQRETNGDGRTWSDYLSWFEQTLKLPLNMMIFVPSELVSFVNSHRPTHYRTQIIQQELTDIPYASLAPAIAALFATPSYQSKIKHPQRVECKLPFYNILQYSKFKWLTHAVTSNPFQSEYFFWMDAGISRFIHTLATPVPFLHLPPNKLTIQHNHALTYYPIHEQYLWDSQCLMCGTMFGGDKTAITTIATEIDQQLTTRLANQWINNEQILLAYIYKNKPEWFNPVLNNTPKHLMLYDHCFLRDSNP